MSRYIYVSLDGGGGRAHPAASSSTDARTDIGSLLAVNVRHDTSAHDVLRSLGVPPSSLHRLHLMGTRTHKRWRASQRLVDLGTRDACFAVVAEGLRGGGADGGSTGAEDRKAMLEMYAGDKPDSVDPKELRLAKYTTCQLSQEPLAPPVVCDELGQLYNKEAFLNALLSKKIPTALAHLSRKSVHDVQLSELEGASEGVKFGCPITAMPLNGKVRFVVVRDANVKGSKGWVVSKKAVNELKEVVFAVTGGYTEVTPLYPEGEELDAAMKKVSAKLANKRNKESKKRRSDVVDDKSEKGAKDEKIAKTMRQTLPEKSEVYKSLFLDKSSAVAGPTNTSSDFMIRGKRR